MSSLLIFNSSHLKSGKTITNVESSISTETMTFDFKDELESTKLSSNKCFIFGKPLNQLNDISNDSICSPFNSTRDKPSPSNLAIIEKSLRPKEKFSFNKDFILIYIDQENKSNDCISMFSKAYELSPNAKMLKEDPFQFKRINKEKIRHLIQAFKTENPSPLLALYNKNIDFGLKKRRSSSTIIIHTQNLTKIPKKRNSHATARLNYEYSKAKNAAVHVRRLEYAYRMEMITYKFKFECIDKAKIIQCWWRAMQVNHLYNFLATRIQSCYRGRLGRLAIGDALYIIDDIIPFTTQIENVIMKHKVADAFAQIYNRFGYLNFSNRIPRYLETITEKYREYYINKCIKLNGKNIFVRPTKERCEFNKTIYDSKTQNILNHLKASIIGFLLRNNERYMGQLGYKYHPYLYYKMKYQKVSDKRYKEKIQLFHKLYSKFRVLNLKVNKGYENEFDYLNKLLKKELIFSLANKVHFLNQNKKLLHGLVYKYDLKKYFKYWIYKKDNVKKMQNMFYIPEKFTSKHKLIKMKKEKKKLNYRKLAIDLENIYIKHIKGNFLKRLMKYSPKYQCRLLIHKNVLKNIKPYFDRWNIKRKASSLLEHINKLGLRQYFNIWSDFMYHLNPKMYKLKLLRNRIKAKERNNNALIKKKFNQYKHKIFDDLTYQMKKYKEENLKLLRLHLWKNNALKLKKRQNKYINAIMHSYHANEKYFLSNALEFFFNKWKIHNVIYKRYVIPNKKLKSKMFALMLENTYRLRQLIIYKAYFFKTIFILSHLKSN